MDGRAVKECNNRMPSTRAEAAAAAACLATGDKRRPISLGGLAPSKQGPEMMKQSGVRASAGGVTV